jgi:DNA-binding HxlR family transcriptional regulator
MSSIIELNKARRFVQRTSFESAECPVARSLDVIGDWWSLLIVRDALAGRRRFGEFQKSLGLSRNILATRLRTLVADGILEQVPRAGGGAHKDYVLTEKGRSLELVLIALRQWGTRHCFEGETCGTILVDRQTGRPVRPLEARAEDGRPLGLGETEIRPRPAETLVGIVPAFRTRARVKTIV